MGAFNKKAESGGGDFELVPAGTFRAILVGLIDLGTQQVSYGGEVDWKPKVFLCWELTTEKKENGESFLIGRDYTNSFHEKSALRGVVEKWAGRKFNEGEEFALDKLLGKGCLLSIVQSKTNSGKDFSKVEGVSKLEKGTQAGTPTHEPVAWEMGQPLEKVPDWLPFMYGRKITDVIRSSTEMTGQAPAPANSNGNGGAKTRPQPAAAADEDMF